MVARATAPDALGPGTVFPDAGQWDFSQGLQGEDNYSNSSYQL
jgi:alpha-1,3-glucan synthase